MMLTKRFSTGDAVPDWVLRAPTLAQQRLATFATDVIVEHSGTPTLPRGPVRVRPVRTLGVDETLINLDRGADGHWHGGGGAGLEPLTCGPAEVLD